MRFKSAFNLSHWSKSISAIGFRDHPKVTLDHPKVTWSYIKGGKGGKDHSFFHEKIGRRRAREQGRFLDKKEKEAAVWHTYQAALQQNQNSRKTRISRWSVGLKTDKFACWKKKLFCWNFLAVKRHFSEIKKSSQTGFPQEL